MLTQWQKDHIEEAPADQPLPKRGIVSLNLLNEIDSIRSNISRFFPELKIWWIDEWGMGLLAKEAPKLYVLGDPKDFPKYIPQFNKFFPRPPIQQLPEVVIWQDGLPWPNGRIIEVYLAHHRAQEPHDYKNFFEVIKADKKLKKDYQKILFDDYDLLRQYLETKYEFMNRALLSVKKPT